MAIDLNAKIPFNPRGPNEVDPNTKTIKTDTYVSDLTDTNQLHQFASYNALFTLSTLSKDDLENTKFFDGPPHDIILRSSGIADSNFASHQEGSANARERYRDPEYRKTLNDNERMAATLGKSTRTFKKDRDMYFRSVEMKAIPGPNEQRRLTSVTTINMTIIEPAGITLFERLKAAAFNNRSFDHIDHPYLLTVEFTGFKADGSPVEGRHNKTMKRVIPIKITNVQMSVNSGGTEYSVQAVPYNEFAYMNRFNYVRTSGALKPKNRNLNTVFVALENLLNEQNQSEKKTAGVGIPDIYRITIDPSFNADKVDVDSKSIETAGMFKQVDVVAGRERENDIDLMKINSGNAITKILEDIMKSHPLMTKFTFEAWKSKVATTLLQTQKESGTQGVYNTANDKENPDMYFPYFKVKASVIPLDPFDSKRQKHQKLIHFVVEPYKVHAYSLAIPGASTGQNFRSFVYKTYNYMFTGENVDVLECNIDYKYSYFQSRLKDVDASSDRQNIQEPVISKIAPGNQNPDNSVGDGAFQHPFEVGIATNEKIGPTGVTFTKMDQFIDELTHPLADMVNIRLEILGDPAWLGQSQFIPAVPGKPTAKNIARGPNEPDPIAVNTDNTDGISQDKDIGYWRGNVDAIWNSKLRCYNSDLAEPIIMLNFKMPPDVNTNTGVYEMGTTEQAMFSGLYRVISMEHNFVDGKYTNVLECTRFNNQGVYISDPIQKYSVTNFKDKTSVVVNTANLQDTLEAYKDKILSVTNIKGKVTDFAKDVYKNIKSNIKGRLG